MSFVSLRRAIRALLLLRTTATTGASPSAPKDLLWLLSSHPDTSSSKTWLHKAERAVGTTSVFPSTFRDLKLRPNPWGPAFIQVDETMGTGEPSYCTDSAYGRERRRVAAAAAENNSREKFLA